MKKDNAHQIKLPRGIKFLTYEDTLQAAYLESKSYSDNTAIASCIHDIENILIAKDINNASKDRLNLSLKYESTDNEFKAFILAYQTKDEVDGDSIYIEDLVFGDNAVAGGKVIRSFFHLYKEHYLKYGKLLPIVADFRDETALKLMEKHFDKLSQEMGYRFKKEELEQYEIGQNKFYTFKITPSSEIDKKRQL